MLAFLPLFLSLDEVLEIHRQQIQRYGGSHGLRDVEGLESAVATPQATFGGEFLHPSVPAMGAAYLFHLCQNHAFIDGNKRVGANAAITFLLMNDWVPLFTEAELVEIVLAVASAGCPDAAASKRELVITGPCEKGQVAYREFVEGTVKDPNAQVWVIINPQEVGDFWVQPAVTVRSDGKWRVLVYFGEPEHNGKPYQLAAVANPKEPLKEGQLLKSWPEAQWRSDPVNVVRK